jgi:hypothetical protein
VTKRRTSIIAAAGAAALLVAFGGGALAASGVLSPKEESQAIIDDAASQLGVEPSELSSALKQALKNRIDAAVEAGRLTEEQATELKERIDTGDFPLLGPGLYGHRGFHGPGIGHFGHGAVLAAAASYLGVTEAELRARLEDRTLAEIAKEQGKSVSGLVQAMVTATERELDEAVADGKLTKDQADTIKANLESRIESLVNGEAQRGGFGRHHGWGGSESPRGPPAFHGSSA